MIVVKKRGVLFSKERGDIKKGEGGGWTEKRKGRGLIHLSIL